MLKKNVKLVFAVVLMSLIGFSSQTFAQNYSHLDNWSRDAGMDWWNYDVPPEYSMTTKQIAKINNIRAKSSKKILPLQNKLYTLRGNLRGHNGYDVQELRSYRNKISRLENKISEINMATRVQIQKVLGKNQLTYFNNGGYGWWDMADDCWYSPNTSYYGTYGRGRDRMRMYYYDRCRW